MKAKYRPAGAYFDSGLEGHGREHKFIRIRQSNCSSLLDRFLVLPLIFFKLREPYLPPMNATEVGQIVNGRIGAVVAEWWAGRYRNSRDHGNAPLSESAMVPEPEGAFHGAIYQLLVRRMRSSLCGGCVR